MQVRRLEVTFVVVLVVLALASLVYVGRDGAAWHQPAPMMDP